MKDWRKAVLKQIEPLKWMLMPGKEYYHETVKVNKLF